MFIAVALALAVHAPVTPCEVITRPANHWGSFTSSFVLDEVSIRVTEGLTSCTFNQAGAGFCSLIRPKTVVVKKNGQETWFAVPDDKGADLTIDQHAVTCTIRSLITTD